MNKEFGPIPEQKERAVIEENIPHTLKSLNQWICWKYEHISGRNKPTKVPYNPVKGIRTDPTQRESLLPFDVVYTNYALNRRYDGIGFGLMPEDGVVGIDLDDCVGDGGQLSPLASHVIALTDSYTELSPSGQGVHILVSADLRDFPGKRQGGVELYNFNRYLTVTGQRIDGTPVDLQPRIDELRELYHHYLMPQKPERHGLARTLPPSAEDAEVLQRMFSGRFGNVYEQIYRGDLSSVRKKPNGDPDESLAFTLLCNGLAYYTGLDPVQMKRILLKSPVAKQSAERWFKPVRGSEVYLDYQIENSIDYTMRNSGMR